MLNDANVWRHISALVKQNNICANYNGLNFSFQTHSFDA